jgi:hypothetical protein
MAVLLKIFGHDIPDSVGMKHSRRGKEPQGSRMLFRYSEVSVGVKSSHFDLMAEPVPPLFFAGEATNRMRKPASQQASPLTIAKQTPWPLSRESKCGMEYYISYC